MTNRNITNEQNRFNLNVFNEETCVVCKLDKENVKQCNNCKYYFHAGCTMIRSTKFMDMVKLYYCDDCELIGYMTKWITQRFDSQIKQNFYVDQKHKYYFNVDQILDHRILKDGKREFFIKWEDYNLNEATWEPEIHLDGANSKLQNYCKYKKLTFSHIKGRVGSSFAANSNEERFVDIGEILDNIINYKNYYHQTLEISISHWEDNLNQDGIYLIRLKQHCFVLGYMHGERLGYISDGTNMCQEDDYRYELQQMTGTRLIPLTYNDQTKLDYCASSAILIAIAMMANFRNRSWETILTVPVSWKNRIINRTQKVESVAIEGHSNIIRWHICPNCQSKRYRHHELRKLKLHMKHCLLNKEKVIK